jgi:hypothetical protein
MFLQIKSKLFCRGKGKMKSVYLLSGTKNIQDWKGHQINSVFTGCVQQLTCIPAGQVLQ